MMPDIRRNPLTGVPAVIAAGRASRPGGIGRTTRVNDPAACPFCEGNEALTPPEVAAIAPRPRPADSPGWTARAVPNKYPAFPGQEVVIHGPRHVDSIADADAGVLEAVFRLWRQRRAHHAATGSAHLLTAINEGAAAGASLAHSHSQLVPFATLPPATAIEVAGFADGCPLCAIATQAAPTTFRHEDGLRSFCPAWSRMPYEIWILPDHHQPSPVDPAQLPAALLDAARRLRRALGGELAWNAILHESPLGGGPFHWYVEILPRLTVQAAIELGAGVWVNVVDPLIAVEAMVSP